MSSSNNCSIFFHKNTSYDQFMDVIQNSIGSTDTTIVSAAQNQFLELAKNFPSAEKVRDNGNSGLPREKKQRNWTARAKLTASDVENNLKKMPKYPEGLNFKNIEMVLEQINPKFVNQVKGLNLPNRKLDDYKKGNNSGEYLHWHRC